MKQLKTILLGALFLCAQFSFAQDPYHYAIGRSQGLMVESIYQIYEDSKGFIWLATNDGLMRYDGFHFKLYEAKEQSSKSGNHIIEDKNGAIWYETFDGYLFHTQGDSLVGIKQQKPLGWREYEIIGDHLFHFSDFELRVYSISQEKWIKNISLPFEVMVGMWQKNNKLYCLSDTLIAIDEKLEKTTAFADVDPKKYMPVIGCDQREQYMFISKIQKQKQLLAFNGYNIDVVAELPQVSFVQNLYAFEEHYWVCAPEGLYVFEKDGSLHGNAPIFKGKNIACAFHDKFGRYWVGTMNEGLMVIENLEARFYANLPEQIAKINDELIIGGKAGNLYALGENGELSLRYKSKSSHGISFLEYDSVYHQIYFVDQALNILDENYNLIEEFRLAAKDIARLDEKYLAVAASGGVGFYRLDQENQESEWDASFNSIDWQIEPRWRYFLTCRGKSIVFDKEKKEIVFTSNLGTHVFSKNGLREVLFQKKPLYLQKLFFHNGKYYGLSSEGLIWKSDGDLKNMLQFAPSEFQERLKRMRVDGDFLFINDNRHLRYYDLKNWDAGSKPIRNWAGQEALNDILIWKNQLYAALDRGVLLLPFQGDTNPPKCPFYLLSLRVNGVTTQIDQLQSLHYLQNTIEIDYAILSYLPSTNQPIYYSINNGTWHLTSSGSRLLRLESLAPGEYEVKFKIGNEVIDQKINFKIAKPFWLKWWFIIGLTAIGLVFIYFYYQYRTTSLRRQNRLLNEKIILEKNLHKATMKSIKSQMNPHFFYNALNTIQSFIFTEDKRRASTFLAKFSKLTRTILEMSDKEKVTVQEELQALALYLEIEQVRFDDDFTFDIIVDPNLDTEIVKLPSMIVQPYVENAIKHGLLHKKGAKWVSISFISESAMLVIIIDDNGIGRKKSEELNAIKNKGHRAFATDANNKRLEILNQTNEKMGVEFVDKHDENQQPMGTKVIIRIPL